MKFRFGLIAVVLIALTVLLAGCTQPPVCGDNVCSVGENIKDSPTYCPQDCGQPKPANILVNAGFEDGALGQVPDSWNCTSWQGKATCKTSTSAQSGQYSMMVSSNKAETVGGAYQYVTLKPNTNYILKALAKIDVLETSNDYGASIYVFPGKGTPSTMKAIPAKTNGWKEVALLFKTGNDTSGAYVYAGQIRGQGNAWFDDATLYETTEEPVQAHLECRNDACIKVDGRGTDQCASNADCIIQPTEESLCANNACKTRELITARLDSTNGGFEYRGEIGKNYITKFADAPINIKINSNTNTVAEKESIGYKLDAKFDTVNTNVKDLVAYINSGDLNYMATFTPGIPVFTDSGTDDDVRIKLLGKEYSVQSITSSSSIELVESSSEKIQIRNGQRFPYDPNNTTGSYPWQAQVTIKDGKLTTIAIMNNAKIWNADNPLVSEKYSLGNVKGVESAEFLEGSGMSTGLYVKFKGFYDNGVKFTNAKFWKGTNVADISGGSSTFGAIQYKDTSSVEHKIPMAIKLGKPPINANQQPTSGTFKFEGQDYSYAIGKGQSGAGLSGEWFLLEPGITTWSTDAQLAADYKIQYTSEKIPANASEETWDSEADISLDSTIINLTGKNGKKYKYYFKASTESAWLVLAGGSYMGNAYVESNSSGAQIVALGGLNGYIDTLENNAGELFFLGTDIDDSDNVSMNAADYRLSGIASKGGAAYYAPDMLDFGAYPGSRGGIYKTAVFGIKEFSSDTSIPANFEDGIWYSYIDTENGNSGTVDTANNNKANYNGSQVAANYAWQHIQLFGLSEYTGSKTNFTKAYADSGTYVELNKRELSFTLPNQIPKTYITLGGN